MWKRFVDKHAYNLDKGRWSSVARWSPRPCPATCDRMCRCRHHPATAHPGSGHKASHDARQKGTPCGVRSNRFIPIIQMFTSVWVHSGNYVEAVCGKTCV